MNETMEGKLCRDPMLRYTNTAKAICETVMYIGDTNDKNNKGEYINIIAWEDLAMELDGFKKGDFISIGGYIKFNDYLNKEQFVIKEFIT